MARVLVTGGAGYIGGALIQGLRDAGDEVVALAHNEAAGEKLAALGAEARQGDLLDQRSLAEAMSGCDLVYNVAGVNSHCPKDPDRLLTVNSEGPGNVVRAAAEVGIGRVIHTSSSTTIGEANGTVGCEDSTHRGSFLSLYDKAKYLGEREAFAAGAETGVEVVSLNPSSVQGPPRKGGTGAIIIAFLNGRLRAFVDTHLSIVDIEDVVAAHLLAADRGEPGQRYLLNGATITTEEALRHLQELSGLDYRPPILSPRVARGIASVSEFIFRLAGSTSPLCRARVNTILHGHRYDGSLAPRVLGFSYTPIRDTFRRTIEWAVAEGLVTRPLPVRTTGPHKTAPYS